MAAFMKLWSACLGCRYFKLLQRSGGLLCDIPQVNHQPVVFATNKHWDPKFREARKRKVFNPEMLNLYDESRNMWIHPDDRKKFKTKDPSKEKEIPQRTFSDRPMNISSTNKIVEEYVPPEGDGKVSWTDIKGKSGAQVDLIKHKGKSFRSAKKIKSYDEEFDVKDFADDAQEIYLEAQKLLENVRENEGRILELVTEHCYPFMAEGLEYKTLRWNFVESIEPPKVVLVRHYEQLAEANVYAQVTVRFHTKQTLAVYDRFGRLIYGSPTLVKDVLEYVVYEKHLSNSYGKWRVHAKIVPKWSPPPEPVRHTYRRPEFKQEQQEDEKKSEGESEAQTEKGAKQGQTLATA